MMAGAGSLFHHTIQVAGIASLEEARMLLDCGVDYLGFPLRLAVHREDVDSDTARTIVRYVGRQRAVVITYLDRSIDILQLVRHVGAGIVQLHGPVLMEQLQELRRMAPDATIIRSVIIRPGQEPQLDEVAGGSADAYIVDTFDPETGATGATGHTHDWSLSRSVIEASPRPVILAGGLTPRNVAEAIRTVRPAAVDVHTGVEDANGAKSRRLVEAFVAEANAAFYPA